jgi:hypothetical protein
MDIKSQARHLSEFLSRYEHMWRNEIMNEYPEGQKSYPTEWLQLLDSLSTDDLYDIDCKKIIPKIVNTSFSAFMQEAIDLCVLPVIPESPLPRMEDWAYNGMKKKKKHEIERIVPRLKKIQNHFSYVVDIGGGVGHLSRVLSLYHSIPTISLDRDSYFQNIGIERLKKFRHPPGAAGIKFVNVTFGENDKDDLKDVFKKESFSLGLHTCGNLANHLIKNTIDNKTAGLLSFGCCYHRLNPETEFPLSHFYHDEKMPKLNLYSLSLATRSHAQMGRETYDTKERVKQYRYALHLFLLKHYGNKHFTEVGECPVKVYWGPFSDYIRSKLIELKIEHSFSDEDFENFFQDENTQRELRTMWLCNLIRWQLGRALEVYLLLDRVLYLEENGYDVSIEQYFDEPLSPRNVGILALKKKGQLS